MIRRTARVLSLRERESYCNGRIDRGYDAQLRIGDQLDVWLNVDETEYAELKRALATGHRFTIVFAPAFA
jgi:hypothetical protein